MIVDLTGKSGLKSWPSVITISENALFTHFKSDNSVTNWGYSFVIEPIYSDFVGSNLSDGQILMLPSLQFLMEIISLDSIRSYRMVWKTALCDHLLNIIEHKLRFLATKEVAWIFKAQT